MKKHAIGILPCFLISFGAMAAEGVYVEKAKLTHPNIRVTKLGSESTAEAIFAQLFAPHFVASGKATIIVIRDRVSNGRNPDAEAFRMISIEIPELKSSFDSALSNPAVRVSYSQGNTVSAMGGLGFSKSAVSGHLIVRRLKEGSIYIELDAKFSASMVRPVPSAKNTYSYACIARGQLAKMRIDELTPEFGAPISMDRWREAIAIGGVNGGNGLDLSCRLVN